MKYIILIAALLCSTIAVSQADQFESDIKEFIRLSNAADWNSVVDMMHPSMFSSFSKEEMATMLNQMKAMGLETQIELKEISNIDDAIEHDGKTYQKFDYDVKVNLTMSDQLWPQKDFLVSGFKSSFGAENIKVQEDKKSITMDGVQSMIAIKDNADSEWKYMSFQGANDSLAKSVLPAAVFEQMPK